MSMLVMCDTVYLKKGNYYGVKFNVCNAMLGICEIYDVTCCSKNPKKHLSYQCEFSGSGIVSSYAKGVYNYYDVQQIEEFVAFKGAYEIASLIETYGATLYKSENFAILKYCYDNYASRAHLLMRVTLELIRYLISLHAYRRMNAMIIAMISLILLKYPFLMMLAMLVAKMPI